jgi:hypothetical protein
VTPLPAVADTATTAPPAATAALTAVAVASSVLAAGLTLLAAYRRGGDEPGDAPGARPAGLVTLHRGAAVAAAVAWPLVAAAAGRWSPPVVLLAVAAAALAAGGAVPRLPRLAAAVATAAMMPPAVALLHTEGGTRVWRAVAAAEPLSAAAVVAAGVVATVLAGSSRSRRALPAAAVLVVVGVAAAGLLVSVREEPTTAAGTPVLRHVDALPGAPAVLVVPGRPGVNVVHLPTAGARVGTRADELVATAARPGAGAGWAEVRLVPGRNRVWMRAGGVLASIEVDAGPAATTGTAAADLPECAATVLGGLIAARPTGAPGCPADRLDPADLRALNATVDFLAGRRVPAIALSADQSPRGVRAAAAVRARARAAGVRIAEPGAGRMPLLAVDGWSGADATIRRVAANALPAEGVYLAPWLLVSALLDVPAGQVTALDFDPGSPVANAYLTALHAAFPGDPACTGGFRSFAGARAGDAGLPVRLFASSRIVMPGMGGHAGHDGPRRWLPDGAVTAVTGPLG